MRRLLFRALMSQTLLLFVSCIHMPVMAPQVVDPTQIEDQEPSNDARQAIPIHLVDGITSVVGKLSVGDTEDWYSFLAPTRGRVVMTVRNIGSETSGVVGRAILQDALRSRKLSVPATSPGEAKSSNSVMITRGQKYFIVVSGEGNDAAAYRIDLRFRGI